MHTGVKPIPQIPEFNSESGSVVRVYDARAWGSGPHRLGVVARLMSEIEPEGRMARLLVAVKDPLERKAAPKVRRPLILGSYVRVEIVGQKLSNIVRVERAALRNGSQAWVMGPKDTLEIRDVKIAWAGNNHVCVAGGLGAGDRLIVSDLGAPVEGMRLRTAASAKAKAERGVQVGEKSRGQEARP